MGSFCLALVSQSPWICWLAGRRWGGGLCRNGVAIGGGKKKDFEFWKLTRKKAKLWAWSGSQDSCFITI